MAKTKTKDQAPAEAAPETEEGVIPAAEKSVGTALLSGLLDEIRHQQKPWPQLAQHEQHQVIERLRMRVESMVQAAVREIASGGFEHVPAKLESITIKDGAKGVLQLPGAGEKLHQLVDHAGSLVTIVFANTKDFTDGMHTIQAEADQRELPIEREAA